MSEFYIVATPIGNLKDITLRALEVLKGLDFIACEDTRHSGILLSHYDIKARLISCRAANEERSAEYILELLDQGQNGAYISDAGTPGISDPGARVVEKLRSTEHEIIPLPGASAASTIVSVAGLCGKGYYFEGFLSPKPGKRKKRVEELMNRNEAVIFYESPFRIIKLLKDIADINSEAKVVIGREMTKKYEEILEGSAQDMLHLYEEKSSIKGELAVLVFSNKKS
ncbi:MAG: 16S rRNA (cytidine(1402)-2'-O)-methyltransferase [Spirochaetales bacterium]|nr:16S rRNA (cytidine(1402)-2'-O)-methyltransferase [Spirochaetales bacterium]